MYARVRLAIRGAHAELQQ
ncbi:unnamed protein product, partial [Didymodactylos carnosus]